MSTVAPPRASYLRITRARLLGLLDTRLDVFVGECVLPDSHFTHALAAARGAYAAKVPAAQQSLFGKAR